MGSSPLLDLRTRTVIDGFILAERDLLRDKGRNNKRGSMPSQIRSRMSSNSGVSAVLICTWIAR